MKRKFLEDLGLSKEAIDKIMDENGKDIESAKGDLDTEKNKSSELEKEIEGYKSQIKDRDKQLDDLKKSTGDNDELKKQIEELEEGNKQAKKDHDAEIAQIKLDSAVTAALTTARAKNVTAAKALLKMQDLKISADGSVVGLKEQIDQLVKDEGSNFMFHDAKARFKGTEPGEPGDPEPRSVTKKEFSSMSYKDRMKLFNEDKEMYDSLTSE